MHRAALALFLISPLIAGCSGKSGAHGPGSVSPTGDMAVGSGGLVGSDMTAAAGDMTTPPDLFGIPRDLTISMTPSIMPPATGALFGAFVGIDNGDTVAFQKEEQLIGRPWVIDNRFYSSEDWGSDRAPWDIANHKIPLVTWQPPDSLDDILAGKEDALIDARAAAAKAWGAPFFLRWGHEMNGNWYPWSGSMNGGGQASGASKYIAAYRYVHDRMVKTDGVTNSVWVWCFNVVDVPNVAWNHWTNYYPGDDYVDWVGLDAYNWGTTQGGTWISFSDLVSAPYADYTGKKPMMLPETSSAEIGGSKAMWIADMQNQLKTNYTNIKAVVWFDINKETDWRIDSSDPTLAAYTKMGLDPYFYPNP